MAFSPAQDKQGSGEDNEAPLWSPNDVGVCDVGGGVVMSRAAATGVVRRIASRSVRAVVVAGIVEFNGCRAGHLQPRASTTPPHPIVAASHPPPFALSLSKGPLRPAAPPSPTTLPPPPSPNPPPPATLSPCNTPTSPPTPQVTPNGDHHICSARGPYLAQTWTGAPLRKQTTRLDSNGRLPNHPSRPQAPTLTRPPIPIAAPSSTLLP